MDERRRFPRLKGPFDGTWEGASGRREVRIVDVSLGGCFVDDLSRPRTGDVVAVRIEFPAGTTFLGRGRVVYVDTVQGFAVAFEGLDATALEHLAHQLRAAGLENPQVGVRG